MSYNDVIEQRNGLVCFSVAEYRLRGNCLRCCINVVDCTLTMIGSSLYFVGGNSLGKRSAGC
jgi:hypothetical protein